MENRFFVSQHPLSLTAGAFFHIPLSPSLIGQSCSAAHYFNHPFLLFLPVFLPNISLPICKRKKR